MCKCATLDEKLSDFFFFVWNKQKKQLVFCYWLPFSLLTLTEKVLLHSKYGQNLFPLPIETGGEKASLEYAFQNDPNLIKLIEDITKDFKYGQLEKVETEQEKLDEIKSRDKPQVQLKQWLIRF